MDDLLLPLFPLEAVLLPEEPLSLHIFEERYKLMVRECLKAKSTGTGQQEFGVILAREQEVQTVGCSARIINLTRKYPDGRMDIFTVGSRRFEVLYTNEEKAYVRGGAEFFDDDPDADLPDEDEAQDAIELFRQAVQRIRKSPDVPIHLPRPYRHLSFRIAASLPLELDFKQQLLSLRNEPERLRRVTRAIGHLITQSDFVQKARSKAGGNGDIHPQG
jgi:ATP-dependent Lon protease